MTIGEHKGKRVQDVKKVIQAELRSKVNTDNTDASVLLYTQPSTWVFIFLPLMLSSQRAVGLKPVDKLANKDQTIW